MKPYKLHSLVKRKGLNTIFMITDRRMIRDHRKGYYIQYTLIEPHDPQYHSYANHDGLELLVSS
jgi:hypothetical protein